MLDEIEVARDVQNSLVKELCLWIRLNEDQRRSNCVVKLKKRQLKYEKEHAENSQKLIDPRKVECRWAVQRYKSQG